MKKAPVNIAVVISGSGRTLDNLLRCQQTSYNVAAVIASKDCSGLNYAKEAEIPYKIIDFNQDSTASSLRTFLAQHHIGLVVLAGFLKKWPIAELSELPVINIHPALLPRYGGQGMYGMHVHRAVKQSGDQESGATVHLVTEQYDEGRILARARVAVASTDDATSIAAKVFERECELYPKAIIAFLNGDLSSGEVLEI